MYEKTTTKACSNKMKSKSKMHVSEMIKRKHAYNSSEMKSVPQAHVRRKIVTLRYNQAYKVLVQSSSIHKSSLVL